jgi:hypothetical protein
MMTGRRKSSGRLAIWGLGLSVALSAGSTASAQFAYNPFSRYSADFQSAARPSYGSNPGLPNQARFGAGAPGLGRYNPANPVADVFNSGAGAGPYNYSRNLPGPVAPYYQSFRNYDERFHRVYRPNERADEGYYEDREYREDLYFKAMKESDPRERARLLKEYQQLNRQASQDLGPTRARAAGSGTSRSAASPSRASGAGAANSGLAGVSPTPAAAPSAGRRPSTATAPRRSASPSQNPGSRATPTPDEILRKSQEMDRLMGLPPTSAAPAPAAGRPPAAR